MKTPHSPTEEYVIAQDHSQLWLRQRLRQAKSSSAADGDAWGTSGTNTSSSPPAPIDSSLLFAGRREVKILHGGQVYRLLVTRNNKLILQK